MKPNKEWICGNCGYRTNAIECFTGSETIQKTGDLQLCLNCGTVHEWGSDDWHALTYVEICRLPSYVRDMLIKMEWARKTVITEDLTLNQEFGIES